MGIPAVELTPKVRDAIMTLMGEVDRLRRELDQMQSRLREVEEVADRDPLVPVLNRRAFVRELSRVISYARRYNEPAAMVYIDMDGFKQVNEAHGHAGGDAALHHVARLLAENIRESDRVGRLGGDEFGVILSRADEALAAQKASMLVNLIRSEPFEFEGSPISLNASAGSISFHPEEDPDAALARADKAMFSAKRAEPETPGKAGRKR